MKKKQKKGWLDKKVIMPVIMVVAGLFLILGVSYAAFVMNVTGTKNNVVTSGDLAMTLTEGKGIELSNMAPMKDEEASQLTPYTMTVRNTGTLDAYYEIKIVEHSESYQSDGCTRVSPSTLKYSVVTDGEGTKVGYITGTTTDSKQVIASGILKAGATSVFEVRLYLDETASQEASLQHFHATFDLTGTSTDARTVPNMIINNSENTMDKTDSSQYFVTNSKANYVWYSGHLWRVVSIDPTKGTSKLVSQWVETSIPFGNHVTFSTSSVKDWLNDTSQTGFLGTLHNYRDYIDTSSIWNMTSNTGLSKPADTSLVVSAVGLLNAYEAQKGSSYLNNGSTWTTLTPNENALWYMQENGALTVGTAATYGVRPVINLQKTVKIASGSGTEDDPYRLAGDDVIPRANTLLNTRYSGEYLSFGLGNNKLYRIVKVEGDQTKIVSDTPLQNAEGSLISADMTFLNGDFLLPSNAYLTKTQISMLDVNHTWADGTTATVSTLQSGELLSGDILTITAVRPAMYLLSTVKITGGLGTKENPYTIGL